MDPENVISDRADDRFGLEVLAPMDDVDLTLKLEEVLLHPEHPRKLLDKEDHVRKRNTSRVLKHNPI
jgi:hypothetical protein